eukprot:3341337-Pleurochrysis_carterae.AAC.2
MFAKAEVDSARPGSERGGTVFLGLAGSYLEGSHIWEVASPENLHALFQTKQWHRWILGC